MLGRRANEALRAAREVHKMEHVKVVADEFGLTVEEILGRGRSAEVAAARHVLMTRMWIDGLPLSEVGRLLGLHHTTVLHGVRKTLGVEAYERITPGLGKCA